MPGRNTIRKHPLFFSFLSTMQTFDISDSIFIRITKCCNINFINNFLLIPNKFRFWWTTLRK